VREVLNDCNRACTVCTFQIDGDGDLLISRLVICQSGFAPQHLSYALNEGEREIVVQLVKRLTDYVK
jgi:hypothetical protein